MFNTPFLIGGIGRSRIATSGGGGFTPSPISLTDDFDDASFDTAKWNATTAAPGWIFSALGGSRSEASGVLTLNPTNSSDTFEGASSVNTFDFSSGKTIYVHLVTPPTNGVASFGAWIDSTQYIRWEIGNFFGDTTISCFKKNDNTDDEILVAGTTWNSTDDRWLALHYTGSVWQAYTAPDSSGSPGTWTLRATSATPNFAATALRVGIFANSDDAASGDVAFDGFCTSD